MEMEKLFGNNPYALEWYEEEEFVNEFEEWEIEIANSGNTE